MRQDDGVAVGSRKEDESSHSLQVSRDVALEALRMVLRTRKATPDAIASIAKKLRIWTVIAPYLESVAADE